MVANLLKDELSTNSLHLHCGVMINSHENSKELANKIVELIEDADEYYWV